MDVGCGKTALRARSYSDIEIGLCYFRRFILVNESCCRQFHPSRRHFIHDFPFHFFITEGKLKNQISRHIIMRYFGA